MSLLSLNDMAQTNTNTRTTFTRMTSEGDLQVGEWAIQQDDDITAAAAGRGALQSQDSEDDLAGCLNTFGASNGGKVLSIGYWFTLDSPWV